MQREESAIRELGSDDDDDDDEDGEDEDDDAEGDESDGEEGDEGEGSGEEGEEEGDGEYFAFVINPRVRSCSCLSISFRSVDSERYSRHGNVRDSRSYWPFVFFFF